MHLLDLYLAHPFWWWVGAAAALLAVEVATGAELFLWPAMAAGTLAVLTGAGLHLPLGVDGGLFAALTIAGALVARRIRVKAAGPDINAPLNRLVGLKGAVVTPFEHGSGRVLVEGAEWAAETESGAATLQPGDRVIVSKVLDGGRLQVRPV